VGFLWDIFLGRGQKKFRGKKDSFLFGRPGKNFLTRTETPIFSAGFRKKKKRNVLKKRGEVPVLSTREKKRKAGGLRNLRKQKGGKINH